MISTNNKLKIGLIIATKNQPNYNPLAPLGLGYVVSYAKRRVPGVLFTLIEDINDSAELDSIDIVGITATTENYYIAQKIARKIKSYKNIPIIIGGPHISMMPHSLSHEMDIGVIGEGEVTFTELINRFLKFGCFTQDWLASVKGIAYRDSEGQFVINPNRDFIADIDSILFPDRKFLIPNGNADLVNYIFTSRGCPYKCKFCLSTLMWRNNVRFFSAEYVVSEIEHLIHEYGLRYIVIFDDLFVADKVRLNRIVDLLLKKRIPEKVSFSCQVRANLVTEELTRQLKTMNVTSLGIGLETFSNNVLHYLKDRTVSAAINQRAIDILNKYHIQVNPSMIFGTHLETEIDLIETLSALYRNFNTGKIKFFAWSLIRPYPGTEIWNVALKNGLVSEKDDMDWERFSDWSNFEFFMNEHYSKSRFFEITLEWFTKCRLIHLDAVQGVPHNLSELQNDICAVKNIISQRLAQGKSKQPGDKLVLSS